MTMERFSGLAPGILFQVSIDNNLQKQPVGK